MLRTVDDAETVGWNGVPEGTTTLSATDGTPAGLQLPASDQAMDTAPVHVRTGAAATTIANASLVAPARLGALAVSV